ncbi:transporter substrate-binding domain-containing protein [Aliamphritea spongicola]|nr:transporter substrate-binding domain-containing protein [Aliamphritea spongicola]
MSFRATLQFFSSLWLVLLVSFPLQAAPETASDAGRTLRVGMPLPGQIPFFWQDETGAFQGIYADTLRLIAEDLDVELDFIPLSQARLQRLFIAGEIDIEAGVSPQLDVPDALQQVSLYSIPFGIVNEVIIYRPELSFPVFILKDLEGQRVATVRGRPYRITSSGRILPASGRLRSGCTGAGIRSG